ncbi:hypothetical protein L484_018270 [Morus notabilis]|uniref:Uncharacterized protein n=1 Tax=Morus notabilis TaxID=981085 RepID=W9SRQ1_9ROSA|nr:hypothetical protein L484_018270 [Morus notabilis]
MKAFSILISILLATLLLSSSSIQARELAAAEDGPISRKALNPNQTVYCGRNFLYHYQPCIPAKPKKLKNETCTKYNRRPGGGV